MFRQTVFALALSLYACSGVPTGRDAGTGGGFFSGFGGGSSSSFGGGSQSNGGGSSQTGGGGGGGSAVGGGSASTGGGTASCSSSQPLALEQLNSAFRYFNTSGGIEPVAFVDQRTRTLFSWPATLSTSLKSMAVIHLRDAGLPTPTDGGIEAWADLIDVTGTVPTGTVTASMFDESSGRSIATVRTKNPNTNQLMALDFVNGKAQFSTLTSFDAPDASTNQVYSLQGTSSSLGAQSGNDFYTIAVTGTDAHWSTAVPFNAYVENGALDTVNHRVLGIGGYVGTGPGMFHWVASLAERAFTSPSPQSITMSGVGIPDGMNGGLSPRFFSVYDAPGNRLLVSGTRMGMIAGMPVQLPTVIEGNLTTHTWSTLHDGTRSLFDSAPLAVDSADRRFFTWDFTAWSMAPQHEFENHQLKVGGQLPRADLTAAARLSDGRIVASNETSFFTFDSATARWQPFGKLTVPATAKTRHSLTFDAAGNRLLLFGGVSSSQVHSNDVWALSTDGATITKLAITGTLPPARRYHAAVMVGDSLVIGGGVVDGDTSVGDVWALNTTSLTWRKLGDASARLAPALIAHGGEVWLVGGLGDFNGSHGEPSIEAFDIAAATSHSVTVTGTWPGSGNTVGYFNAWAPLGNGLAAIDIGNTIDSGSNQLFELAVTGNTAEWKNSDPHAMDGDLQAIVGVAGTGCDDAYFIGGASWRVHR